MVEFNTINPETGLVLKSYFQSSPLEVESLILELGLAQRGWAQETLLERLELMKKLRGILQESLFELAHIIKAEMGKSLKEAEAEVKKSCELIEFYVSHPPEFRLEKSDEIHLYQPQGILLGVMPWNFPVWQILRFAIPNLIMGHGVLVKASETVAETSLFLEKVFSKAFEKLGHTPYKNIFLEHEDVESVIAHPLVSGVSLTGSVRAGRVISQIASKYLKKCVLELGGSDPVLVFDDVDVSEVSLEIVKGRMMNMGQSCISPKRILIHESIFENFKTQLIADLKSYLLRSTPRPLARKDLKEGLQKQVEDCINQGAKIIYESGIEHSSSAYFKPLILEQSSKSLAPDTELFGPVISIQSFSSVDEALKIANESVFGLGASVYCKDQGKALGAAEKIKSGMVAINQILRSRPQTPFGGIKNSGYGKELGMESYYEFTNHKIISL